VLNTDRTELKNKLREERNPSINKISSDFYKRVQDYIIELENEIKNINNPRSVESKMLEDELESAIIDVENIFIYRIKKITTYARSHAFSKNPSKNDLDKLLPEERKVYDSILSAIHTSHKELIGPIINPEVRDKTNNQAENTDAESSEPEHPIEKVEESQETTAVPSNNDTEKSRQSDMDKNESKTSSNSKNDINEEYVVVRALKDIPTFKAVDNRNYKLNSEDVVVLPAPNANGLVKRNAAQLIKIN
jgi:DNA replication factor GINS